MKARLNCSRRSKGSFAVSWQNKFGKLSDIPAYFSIEIDLDSIMQREKAVR